MVLRAFKVALDPTSAQRDYLSRASGVARFAYNWALEEWRRQQAVRVNIDAARHGHVLGIVLEGGDPAVAVERAISAMRPLPPSPNAYALHGQLTAIKHQQFPWMAEVTAFAVREAVTDVGKAYDSFFRRLSEGAVGRAAGEPRFRARDRYGLAWHADQGNALETTERAVKVPGLGMVRVARGRRGYVPASRFNSKSKTWSGPKICGIGLREIAGRWHASVRMDVPASPPRVPRATGTTIGVEVGVRELAVTSGGMRIGGVRDLESIQRAERRLILWQRRASRRYQDGQPRVAQSAGWREAQREVRKYYAIVARCRADLLHNTSRKIVDTGAERIVMRDMQVKAMISRSCKSTREEQRTRNALAPMVAKVGMYELRRQVEYKQAWVRGMFVAADNDYPSTRRCSACGVVRDAEPPYPGWTCTACGVEHDRELNAAANLRDFSPPSGGADAGGGTRRRKTSRKAGTTTAGSGKPGAASEQSDVTDGPHGAERVTAPGALGPGNQARGKPRGRGSRKGAPAGISAGNGGASHSVPISTADTRERRGDSTLNDHVTPTDHEGASGVQASRSQSGAERGGSTGDE